jgi:hypothetical protein
MRSQDLLLIVACCLQLAHSWTSVPIGTLGACRRQLLCHMSVTGIESTPNPSSFLVKLSAPLVGLEDMSGSLQGRSYSSVDLLTPTQIAEMLRIDGIEEVYCMATALTINKKASAKWDILLPLVITALGADKDEQLVLLQGLLLSSSAETSTTASCSGQVRIRMQISNKIPIQIEAIGYLGTAKRMKLPPKFQEHMQIMVDGGIDFFAGRKWVDRGVRYLESTDDALDETAQEELELVTVLQTELEEVDAAYSKERLAAIVTESSGKGVPTTAAAPPEASNSADLNLEAVDRCCDLAEQGSEEALTILANFVASHEGGLAARRNALAYLGGSAGSDAAATGTDLVFDAVASALQNEKNPTMRRTAGDALSDLGDARAVPCAVRALGDKSKLVQWRAARILGELGDSMDAMAVLKQASFSSDYAFEVAFEIKDAMRKVRARMQSKDSGIDGGGPAMGPMWKQIQEGTRKDVGSS